jgi:hypothetical protein
LFEQNAWKQSQGYSYYNKTIIFFVYTMDGLSKIKVCMKTEFIKRHGHWIKKTFCHVEACLFSQTSIAYIVDLNSFILVRGKFQQTKRKKNSIEHVYTQRVELDHTKNTMMLR